MSTRRSFVSQWLNNFFANYTICDDHQRQYFLSSQTTQSGVLVNRQNYNKLW